MFSFRRKPKQPPTPRIRSSPSLPELKSQGIPWPENLVDLAAIQQVQVDPLQQQGAAKVSFEGSTRPVPFHKPFRDHVGPLKHDQPTVPSLFVSNPPPSAFPNRAANNATPVSRYSHHRRARVPPTFNLMVVGGKGSGKTSLLRLLLESADISPGATLDQRTALQRFLKGSTKATESIETVCLEICESKFDRLLFSVIDTPGLDFQEGKELKLERQVNGIVKYVDAQYADTMNEESKVVRQSKGDQHIHLCIYIVDPDSIMTPAARQALSTFPIESRSQASFSHKSPPDLVPDNGSGDESDNEDSTPTMSPAEVRVIRRLSARCNVLPIVGRADSLTDEKLQAVKHAIRKSMSEAGLDFGVLDPTNKTPQSTPTRQTQFNENSNSVQCGEPGEINGRHDTEQGSSERQSRPVVRLRPRHTNGLARSRSRGRRDLSLAAAEEYQRPLSPDSTDPNSLANVRFSAYTVAKADMNQLLPFAVIAPEGKIKRQRPVSMDGQYPISVPSSPVPPLDDEVPPQTPASAHNARLPYRDGPPEDLRGVFIRKFRWGFIDVLDPSHCDFAALRTTVLSTHFKLFKSHTKDVLYEKYRTEKLLARRATQNISEYDRLRLLEDLGL